MLDQQTLTAYQQDGAVVLRNAISPQWIDRLREGVEQNLRQPGPYAKHYTPAGNPGMFLAITAIGSALSRTGISFSFQRQRAGCRVDGIVQGQSVPRACAGERTGDQGAHTLAP